MKVKISAGTKQHAEILLTLPAEVLDDLKKIASCNNTDLENLVYSYIIDGIASDSRIVKRMAFSEAANETLGNKSFHSKTAQEIVNDFNLVY